MLHDTDGAPQVNDEADVGDSADMHSDLCIDDDCDDKHSEASSTVGCDGTLEDIDLDL